MLNWYWLLAVLRRTMHSWQAKSVALVDVQQALRDPLAAINQAKASAKVWQAAAAIAAPAAAQSTGQKRIVAVTACPTA